MVIKSMFGRFGVRHAEPVEARRRALRYKFLGYQKAFHYNP
jgi:hypothetical protein